jgi:protein-S-isoprenylcysteine O-methyltransferase Ste14
MAIASTCAVSLFMLLIMLPTWDASFGWIQTQDCCFVVRPLALFYWCWKSEFLERNIYFQNEL